MKPTQFVILISAFMHVAAAETDQPAELFTENDWQTLRIVPHNQAGQTRKQQLSWLSEALQQQGVPVMVSDDHSLLFQGTEQQAEQLNTLPYISDVMPVVPDPFITDHAAVNSTSGITLPPDNHPECDVYPIPADPVNHVDHTGDQVHLTYASAILSGEYPGLIYLPSQQGRILSGRFPLAVLIHGRHYDHDWYQQIQQHLARNGIASVAIQYSADHVANDYYDDAFLDRFEDHMEILFGPASAEHNPAHNKFNGKIALLGHSMGGGFAVRAAQWLQEQPESRYDVQLMSVINLAPNPQDDDWFLTPDEAQGLLVIFGSDDADDGVNSPGASGFLTYDWSGYFTNEFSFNGYWRNRFTKSMVYLGGANHNSFIDDDVPAPQGLHHDLALGYINAYLRWSLKNDHIYRALFKQQHRFYGNPGQVSLQYSDGSYRRVLDHFEGPFTGWNALGGRNRFYNLTRQKGPADMNGNTHKSGHDTRVLQLDWNANLGGVPVAQFHLPIPFTFGTDYRDLSRLRYLSFRMGQLAGSADADQDLEFIIRLTSNLNGVVKSEQVLLSDVGHIPSPLALGQDSQTKTAMNTVMIPLCVFAGIDFEQVSHLSFQFNHPDRMRGSVQLDSLEFLY